MVPKRQCVTPFRGLYHDQSVDGGSMNAMFVVLKFLLALLARLPHTRARAGIALAASGCPEPDAPPAAEVVSGGENEHNPLQGMYEVTVSSNSKRVTEPRST